MNTEHWHKPWCDYFRNNDKCNCPKSGPHDKDKLPEERSENTELERRAVRTSLPSSTDTCEGWEKRFRSEFIEEGGFMLARMAQPVAYMISVIQSEIDRAREEGVEEGVKKSLMMDFCNEKVGYKKGRIDTLDRVREVMERMRKSAKDLSGMAQIDLTYEREKGWNAALDTILTSLDQMKKDLPASPSVQV